MIHGTAEGNGMTLFLTDLDHTMIYSHRHTMVGPIYWVEELNGKRQSFMTAATYEYFLNQEWLETVPVTTRTRAQYARLEGMASELGWRSALICNGAILLRDGVEDPTWSEESRYRSRPDQEAYGQALEWALSRMGENAVVRADPFLFYIKTPNPEEVFRLLKEQTDPAHLTVHRDARKVYCIPASLNKGTALVRYRSLRNNPKTIAAGDSSFDIPMLRHADWFFCPESLSAAVSGSGQYCSGNLISDAICAGLEQIRTGEPISECQQ